MKAVDAARLALDDVHAEMHDLERAKMVAEDRAEEAEHRADVLSTMLRKALMAWATTALLAFTMIWFA